MLSPALVIAASFAYLLLLFAVAYWADARSRLGRSVIGNAWVYALSMGVYCTAWTYFGSVGRAAGSGVWFLPIYLGPMLAMILACAALLLRGWAAGSAPVAALKGALLWGLLAVLLLSFMVRK